MDFANDLDLEPLVHGHFVEKYSAPLDGQGWGIGRTRLFIR